jgi:hypothetical protein
MIIEAIAIITKLHSPSLLPYIPHPTVLHRPTHFKSAIIRKMSDASKVKSDDEWQAILTPEQVCPSWPYCRIALRLMPVHNSSG